MSKSISKVVPMGVPIIRQFDHSLLGLGAISDEGQCKTAGGVIFFS